MRTLIVTSLVVGIGLTGCSGGGSGMDAGKDAGPFFFSQDAGGTGDGGGTGDAGAGNTVQNVRGAGTAGASIEIDNAVVAAAYSYSGTSGVTGTFYIQDQAPNSTQGIAVYVASSDMVMFPAIGDVVSVTGVLNVYEGELQIASTGTTPLGITDSGPGGRSSVGAYSPAGNLTAESATSDFAATVPNAHPELVGTALLFGGPLQITDRYPTGFVDTSPDGGTVTEGFQISNGIWVNDSFVYYDCMRHKGPDGGTLYPDLSGGIAGVWDRYQDPGVDGGPAYPVLFPMSCSDLNPLGIDAGTTTPPDAGAGFGDAGPGNVDAGQSGNTVGAAITAGATGPQSVTVDSAVVVAAYSYQIDGGTTGSFYIQDPAPNSATGLEVYVAATDTGATFPAIGDVVNVSGYLSVYDGQLQIATSTTPAVALAVTVEGTGGRSSSGAYSPAGVPTQVSSTSGYAYTVANAHPEQVGTVIQFAGPLTVTADMPAGFVYIKADGGSETEGFQITGNVWAYDGNVYHNCMKGLGPDGGPLYPTLTRGISGVWERYEDADSGTVYPVLIPMSCSDFSPAEVDAGTVVVDAGSSSSDAGSESHDAGSGSHDAGTGTMDAGSSTATNTVQDAVNAGPTGMSTLIETAVVVASRTTNGTSGVLFLEDQAPNSGNGIEVYIATADMVSPFPAVGDILTVSGEAALYEGALELETKGGVSLTVTAVASGGMASSGAESPAGAATMIASSALTEYAHSSATAHSEQVGTVIQIPGPLTIQAGSTAGFSKGWVTPRGLWILDSNVTSCTAPSGTNGIRGVWDRYQSTTGGTVDSVIIPTTCADLEP
jgi:hypothetical protein